MGCKFVFNLGGTNVSELMLKTASSTMDGLKPEYECRMGCLL